MNDPLQQLLNAGALETSPFPPNSRYNGIPVAKLELPGRDPVPYLRRRFIPPPERFAVLQRHTVVEGDRIDRVIAGQAEVRGVPVADMRKSFVERSPLRRMTTADDIATLAVYLCSDAAKNLSGQCIAVTAGEPAV